MNDFEKLKKQDNKIPPMNETLQGQAFETAKRKITGICKSLSYPTDLYKSEYTINSINAYLGISESFGRILYSQISNYVFDLEPNDRATFVSNLDKLLQNVMNNPSLSNDIKKAVARIYDHTQLAVYQIENVQNTFAKGTKEVEDKLIDSVKGVEKEYVGILGIFSSVILACIGGFIFSTAVFSNLEKASIYRLVFIISLIGLVVINIIYVTFHYLDRMIHGKQGLWTRAVWIINGILVGIMLLDGVAWYYGLTEKREENINTRFSTYQVSDANDQNNK